MIDIPIVDAHVHLWNPQRFRMPWIEGDAVLEHQFEATEFHEHTRGLPVEQVVYVQVDVTPGYGFLEARWASQVGPPVGGVVAWAPLEDGAIVRSYLDALIELGPSIKGVRRLLQSEADPDFLVDRGLLDGLRLLPEYGLSFDICIKHHQLARTVDMVRACPETQFILDHVAKPDIRGRLLDPWREHMDALARLPNVVCKVSGAVTEADHARWTLADLQPYLFHVLDVFGEDRVLFGSDWPVVTLASDYRRWVETLDALTFNWSAIAKRKLWADNARRVYRLQACGQSRSNT